MILLGGIWVFAFWRDRCEERGAVMILIIGSLVGLLAFAALSIDVGVLYAERIRLHNIADAAALAGAMAWASEPTPSDREAAARDEATNYAVLNGLAPEQITVMISGTQQGEEVSVNVHNVRELTFAKVIAIDNANVGASATAAVGVPTALNGKDVGNLMPMGAELPEGQVAEMGTSVTLKWGPHDDASGNFHLLALGGTGGSTLEENLKSGYQGVIYVGANLDIEDMTETETGNKSGKVEQGLADRFNKPSDVTWESLSRDLSEGHSECLNAPRVVTVPIVDFTDVNGRREIVVTGFALFWLVSAPTKGSETKFEVEARFIRTVTPSFGSVSLDDPNYGVSSVKLIR